MPYLGAAKELKTKPTQHSVNELRRIGLQPDMLVCRSEQPLDDDIKEKLSLFCDVERRAVPMPAAWALKAEWLSCVAGAR